MALIQSPEHATSNPPLYFGFHVKRSAASVIFWKHHPIYLWKREQTFHGTPDRTSS